MIGLPGVFRLIPWWLWAGAGLFLWGAWNKHAAKTAIEARERAEVVAETARIQQRGTAAALTETTRRITVQAKVNRNASTRTVRAAAAAASAAVAGGGLRADAAALAASAAACHPAPGRDGEADRLARVLGEVVDEYRAVAAAADRAVIAGQACEQSYSALIEAPAAGEQP